jgi:tetratricopeptide (TPR) repeat protein
LLARHGFQEEASEVIAELRRRYEARPHPVVTAWINLADGIAAHRTLAPSEAIDKVRRAHALALASNNLPMQALAAAWLAHLLWATSHEVEAAVRYAREALRLALPDDHKARARACLVVADIFALGLCDTRAERWFGSARRHAASARDNATKSALSFNLGTIQVTLLRQAVLSRTGGANARLAELHRSVSENVDAALGIRADEWTWMQQAGVLSLLGRAQEALALYARHGRAAPAEAERERSVWLADEAWCWCRAGDVGKALELAPSATQALRHTTQVDDVASVHALLAKVCAAAGDGSRAESHASAADAAWREFAEYQARCASLCDSITEVG